MNALRGQLLTVMRGFDDDAYAALASRGLLRRAQKEAEKLSATVVEESTQAIVFGLAELRVQFDTRGPAHAHCSCPASGVCQHILTVALQIPRLIGAADARDADESAGNVMERLRDELLGFSHAELLAHAGKAGYRWAWQFVHDLPDDDPVRIGGTRSITITFQHPPLAFHYAGGGLASIVTESNSAKVEKQRVAAVLAFQRAHAVDIAPPEVAAPKSGALDPSKHASAARPGGESLDDMRRRLRESAQQLLAECVELGLAHLSEGVQERVATLAVWAQGAEYYRLAQLLRRIADHVEQMLSRIGSADQSRLLDECALACGILGALDESTRQGVVAPALLGHSRTRYEGARTIQLIGLGARPWRSSSGYVGLTMILWSPSTREFLSCTDARPETTRGFDPTARYRASGPWSGLGAPAMATGRRLTLSAPQVNALGRISTTQKTALVQQSVCSSDELLGQLDVQSEWNEVRARLQAMRRSLLAEPSPMSEWTALRPHRFGAPAFDSTRQVLEWPLFDARDSVVTLEVPYLGFAEHAIRRIEGFADDPPAPGAVVIARVVSGLRGLIGEPLSVVSRHADASRPSVDALYFDAPRRIDAVSKLVAAMKRSIGDAGAATAPEVIATPLSVALREFRHFVQREAERGLSGERLGAVEQQLAGHAQKAEHAGFPLFARVAASDGRLAVRLLRLHYVWMQYERMGANPLHALTTDSDSA